MGGWIGPQGLITILLHAIGKWKHENRTLIKIPTILTWIDISLFLCAVSLTKTRTKLLWYRNTWVFIGSDISIFIAFVDKNSEFLNVKALLSSCTYPSMRLVVECFFLDKMLESSLYIYLFVSVNLSLSLSLSLSLFLSLCVLVPLSFPISLCLYLFLSLSLFFCDFSISLSLLLFVPGIQTSFTIELSYCPFPEGSIYIVLIKYPWTMMHLLLFHLFGILLFWGWNTHYPLGWQTSLSVCMVARIW